MEPCCIVVRDFRELVGGLETWVEQLAHGLPAHGVRVIVLVPEVSRDLDSYKSMLPAEVRFIEACSEPGAQAARVLEELRRLANAGNGGVYFTLAYPYVNIAGINLCAGPWRPIPVMHGRHPSAFDWMCLGPPRRVVVPSPDFAAECRRQLRARIGYLRTLGKVKYIPHGVPLPSARVIHDKGERQVGTPLRLAAVTRLNNDAKRPLDYVRLARELVRRGVDFELTIAGSGPALEEMMDMARRWEVATSIVFAGPLSRECVYSLLVQSDVLISTSESEAFGLAVAEALACGCAVVSSDIPGAIQTMVNGHTGYRVPVGDVAAFAESVQRLVIAPERMRQMGVAGHHLIRKRFSEAAMLSAYANLIAMECRDLKPDPTWRAREPLFRSPGEAVGVGFAERLGVPRWMRDWVNKSRRGAAE